jgi:3',5'-cyclic AMP phosphodiesterase CpdA
MRTKFAAKAFCTRSYGFLVWLGFVLATLGDLPAQVLTRGSYLQNGSHTNITIRWRTDVATDSRVRYGTSLANLSFTNDVAAVVGDHEVRLKQLSPDTKYFYAIGDTTTQLAGEDPNHFFVTAPVPGTPKNTRIWAIGDFGTALPEQSSVRDAYEAFTGARHTDLWLMLGDNAYESGLDAEYQTAVFDVYTNLFRKSVVWPTLGNHDTAQATEFSDAYPYFDIFTLPKQGEAGGVPSGTEHYYAYDYGNIHFICLDSMTGGRSNNSPMYAWLTNDLAANKAMWTIAYWHHPPYTKGSHDSDFELELIEMREVFLPVLEQGGVDLVLGGHSHTYERSHLLDQHYGDSSTLTEAMKRDAGGGRAFEGRPYHKHLFNPRAHQGAVYAVVGSSGHTGGGELNHPAMHVSLNELGSLVLDIHSNRLDATFLRETGATNDAFTIVKVNSTTSLRILSATLNSSGHCTLTWAAVGGLRYRVSYRDGDPSGVFTDLVQSPVAEINLAPEGAAATQSFTDNFTLTGGAPVNGARYFRVRVVRWN